MNATTLPEQASRSAAKKFKIGVLILGYACLVTGLAYLSIDKALNTSQEMGRYQIEETRIFQGEQKAKELEDFMKERTGQLENPPLLPEGGESEQP